MAGNSGDALRALAQEALERGVHPDREQALRDFVGDESDQDTDQDTSTDEQGGSTTVSGSTASRAKGK